MSRREYLERLEQLLLVLQEEEREEALQYYSDYFDDAGIENEDRVILELGSPEEVAAKIRAGYAGEYGEYSEQGYEDARFQKNQEIVTAYYNNYEETGKNSVFNNTAHTLNLLFFIAEKHMAGGCTHYCKHFSCFCNTCCRNKNVSINNGSCNCRTCIKTELFSHSISQLPCL